MSHAGRYVFKCADARHEFEQIHQLNYRTFVNEIAQHADNGSGFLVDKFHNKNAYFIALKEDRLVGMLGAHDQPPFSIADRLADPHILTRAGMRPLEVRLLAVEPKERYSTVFFGLVYTLYCHAVREGYTHVLVSGLQGRLDLYQRLGFAALGPAVPCGKAAFVPMMIDVEELPFRVQRMKQLWEVRLRAAAGSNGNGAEIDLKPGQVCLLPGPVSTSPAVREAYEQPPLYHRGPEFIQRFVEVRRVLGHMVGGRDVAILNGSGTLANESIAATLAAMQKHGGGNGMLLVNGEFGQRLAKQATRFGLKPRILNWPWGKPWDLGEIDEALVTQGPEGWVWGVHQESSTGVLNDLPGLVDVARNRGARVCVDCISSLGAVPLDLREVFLASGATGKSLGSYAGAALIFADAGVLRELDCSSIPSYFDVAAALDSDGPCYTFPSHTLMALQAALAEYATSQRANATYQRYARLGEYVREELRRLDLTPLADEACSCPVITTFTPPGEESSADFVERCRRWGFAIGGQSAYLALRRYVQIATMGAVTREMVSPLFERVGRWLPKEAVVEATG